MSLISRVGRRSLTVRLLIATIYIVLIAGATTMVYPFLIMVSGSFKTSSDRSDYDLIPAFWTDDLVLYRKHLEAKYNNLITEYQHGNRVKAYEFRAIDPPPSPEPRLVEDWRQFEASYEWPDGYYSLGYMLHQGDSLRLWKHREFRAHLMELSEGRLQNYNRMLGTSIESWEQIGGFQERLTERRYQLTPAKYENLIYEFKRSQPAWFRNYVSLDGKYVQAYLEPLHGLEIEKYNAKLGTNWESYRHLVLPRTAPEHAGERRDWEQYVREELNLQFIRVRPEARPLFAQFLREQFADDVKLLNERNGTEFGSFEDVTYPESTLWSSNRLVEWGEFLKVVPAEHLYVDSPEFAWRDYLRDTYGNDLRALEAAHEKTYGGFDRVPLPSREVEYATFLEHRRTLRWEFTTANYKHVLDYIVLHGRALLNTVIYCALAIGGALTVTPLAAYALSRYKPPSTYKVLLIGMATMAFPGAVVMIPNFLLLKNLGLLNTFAALVLPGLANGYMIFLLKGFFDALPRELYESATLDGANEWVMFWQLTMALSKPILAVLALGAFTGAYGNFMFAFILCPDQKMWTLMVFLYQFQHGASQGQTFAALLVAAIPTFIVFVFCQNIIIRGIVVPVEK